MLCWVIGHQCIKFVLKSKELRTLFLFRLCWDNTSSTGLGTTGHGPTLGENFLDSFAPLCDQNYLCSRPNYLTARSKKRCVAQKLSILHHEVWGYEWGHIEKKIYLATQDPPLNGQICVNIFSIACPYVYSLVQKFIISYGGPSRVFYIRWTSQKFV